MSVVICEHCERLIDSDDDLHCFVDQPDGSTEIICGNCQEKAYDRHQENLMEGGGGPTLQEQQAAAMKLK
jgi:hypothetical protein